MKTTSNSRVLWIVLLLAGFCLASPPAQAQYSGGTGEADDPYQIAAAADLIALGETPNDYDKHFILTADIDLSGYTFERAVIAPDINDVESYLQGIPFTGVFDGQGYGILRLHIEGDGYLGLFGQLDRSAEITNLSLESVDISGTDIRVGGFAGVNHGRISDCYSTGTIVGVRSVGGLVGRNRGSISRSYSRATVRGNGRVGGLAGANNYAGRIATSYSTGTIVGVSIVGGLVGDNSRDGSITRSYSTGAVYGETEVGGLVGRNDYLCSVNSSIWDMETSGLTFSDGGFGLTTAEMMDPDTLGLIGFANDPNWILDAGRDYPRLAWEGTAGQIIPEPITDWLDGQGTEEEPYRVETADQLTLLSRASALWDKHFVLGSDIDLAAKLQEREVFPQVMIPFFSGAFDGNGHAISHLTIRGGSYLGLFGELAPGGSISNLGLEAVHVEGTGTYVGGLVGRNRGTITTSYSSGTATGRAVVGGLAGHNEGSIIASYSTGAITGDQNYIGGLVGLNWGSITTSYSAGTVTGDSTSGGLVGQNGGSIAACYSNCVVKGNRRRASFGGLVASNHGSITTSYSSGSVAGSDNPGGLVGVNSGIITSSVWDMETSGLSGSAGGVGLTTDEMMGLYMIGLNGLAEDPNWVLNAGLDYPRLAWQGTAGQMIPVPDIEWLDGQGTPEEPYIIDEADELILLTRASGLWDDHLVLGADIDLDPNLPGRRVFSHAPIQVLSGVFDGNGHTISHLTISGDSYLGLFGRLVSGAAVSSLGLRAVDIHGTGDAVGGLAGRNDARITACYSTGTINGWWSVGGLVGWNGGNVTTSYSVGTVIGEGAVGGLVGSGYKGHGVLRSVWDMEVSGLTVSGGGVGLTTAEMMDPNMLGLNGFANDPNWVLDAGRDYPRLASEGTNGQVIPDPIIDWLEGQGTAQEPYRVDMADQLVLLRRASALWDRHFVLGADIDLDPNLPGRAVFSQAVIPLFSGVFDGNGHTISHLTIRGGGCLGLFGLLAPEAVVSHLGLESVDVNGCDSVGGFASQNEGHITCSYSIGTVIGDDDVGGLVGINLGSISNSYNVNTVAGNDRVGGLVGWNDGRISACYSSGSVIGLHEGDGPVGGLVGENGGSMTMSFWDMETSSQIVGRDGSGSTTVEMQTAATFLEAGWDFIDETENGTDDIWWILEGQDYPRLWWELIRED